MLELIGRDKELFDNDILKLNTKLVDIISSASFLVLGGSGSIGSAVVKEIFQRDPLKLHVVDISENNMVELVRDLRSSFGYIKGDFKTFAIDIGSSEYDTFIRNDGNYDYVLNLSALKHVRSEKDPYTLMRMINVNILNTDKTIKQSIIKGSKKYFCVSTDKAANPVNMMGASKRIMEMFVNRQSQHISISMARFANVAFSDGSLLYGFNKRIEKNQPIVAPNDIKRYFVTPRESGLLCLMSCIFGDNRDIFFPKLNPEDNLVSFSTLAKKYLRSKGLTPHICRSEEEARQFQKNSSNNELWPCFFSSSDTTGEKVIEEFFTENETLDMDRFQNLGIIKNELNFDENKLNYFSSQILKLKNKNSWTKNDIISLFFKMIPNFKYDDKGKYLDGKM